MEPTPKINLLPSLLATAFCVAAAAMVLPVTCLFSRRARQTLWRTNEIFFGSAKPGIYPECGLGETARLSESVTLIELPSKSYHVTEAELLSLVILERAVKTRAAFEFGTADGCTTRNLAGSLEPGGQLFTLNIPPEADSTHNHDVPVGHRFIGTREEGSIRQLWGDSRLFDGTPYQAQCQFIFVDADHSEESVRADTKNALLMIDRQGGVIVWHDALRFGVQKALPAIMREMNLPIHLLARTNLALLCFRGGRAVPPAEWRSGKSG